MTTSEEEATKILSEPKVTATADIHMGEATATAWGCDLTYDYVKSTQIIVPDRIWNRHGKRA